MGVHTRDRDERQRFMFEKSWGYQGAGKSKETATVKMIQQFKQLSRRSSAFILYLHLLFFFALFSFFRNFFRNFFRLLGIKTPRTALAV